MATNARDQLGVDLPDPVEPEPLTPAEPEEPERPDFLLDKFKTIEDQAKGYAESERRMQEAAEAQRRLEMQVQQLTEAVESFTAVPDQQYQPPNEADMRAR